MAATAREELRFPVGGLCFGCSTANASGLQLTFFRDAEGVRCETIVAAVHQGAPGVVHGGIQAVLLDETCCAAAYFTDGGFVVTGELNLRYRRPCPTERPLVVTAKIIAREPRFLRIQGEIREEGGDAPLTIAEGKFYPNPARRAEGSPA